MSSSGTSSCTEASNHPARYSGESASGAPGRVSATPDSDCAEDDGSPEAVASGSVGVEGRDAKTYWSKSTEYTAGQSDSQRRRSGQANKNTHTGGIDGLVQRGVGPKTSTTLVHF